MFRQNVVIAFVDITVRVGSKERAVVGFRSDQSDILQKTNQLKDSK